MMLGGGVLGEGQLCLDNFAWSFFLRVSALKVEEQNEGEVEETRPACL